MGEGGRVGMDIRRGPFVRLRPQRRPGHSRTFCSSGRKQSLKEVSASLFARHN